MKLEIVCRQEHIRGNVYVPGDKVSATHILFLSLLIKEKLYLKNFPLTTEILSILKQFKENKFASVDYCEDNILTIQSTENIIKDISCLSFNRASIILVSALALKNDEIAFREVGGCDFIERPINGHLKLMELCGLQVEKVENGYFARKVINLEKSLCLKFDCSINGIPSVGITCHAIFMAIMHPSAQISLFNTACEPAIESILEILSLTRKMLIIYSPEERSIIINKLNNPDNSNTIYFTLPTDYSYLMTFLGIGIIRKKFKITFSPVFKIPDWLELLIKSIKIDYRIHEGDLQMESESPVVPCILECEPWPGIPSDVGPILLSSFLSYPESVTIIDKVYKSRSTHVQELNKLGYNVKSIENMVIKEKHRTLSKNTKEVNACDIRCGASLIIASIPRNDSTIITNFEQILRGYTKLAQNFDSLNILHRLYD